MKRIHVSQLDDPKILEQVQEGLLTEKLFQFGIEQVKETQQRRQANDYIRRSEEEVG